MVNEMNVEVLNEQEIDLVAGGQPNDESNAGVRGGRPNDESNAGVRG